MGNGNAANGNHGSPSCKRFSDILISLYSTPEVHLQSRGIGYLPQYGIVDDVFRFSTIQVDDMEPPESLPLKLLSLSHRVVIIDLLAIVITLGEPYTLAVNQVYGWNNLYHSAKKFFRSCSPALPLFSGWNCVDQKLSLCSAAEYGRI